MSSADLDAAIQRLMQQLGKDALPSDPKGLEHLRRVVGNLHPDIDNLYSRLGGTRSSDRLYPFLMPPGEVAKTALALRRQSEIDNAYAQRNASFADGMLLLIYDNQSNYIGVHLAEPDAGKGFVLDHDEPDTTPIFADLAELLNAMADCVDNSDILSAMDIRPHPAP